MNTLLNFQDKEICKKLKKLFASKKKDLDKKHNVSGSYDFDNLAKSDKEWQDYLNQNDISVIGIKDVLKHLNSYEKDYVCIENDASSTAWNYGTVSVKKLNHLICDANDRYRQPIVNKIINEYWFVVPREFAEKTLILGSLP